MPFPESNYPSVIRGMTATQSLRLMNAAPELLEALKHVLRTTVLPGHPAFPKVWAAIAKAEGRPTDGLGSDAGSDRLSG